MRKRIVLLLMLAVAAMIVVAAVGAQEDMRVVDNDDFVSPQRAKALFNHDVHNENAEIEDCSVCHHLYENGQLVEDESSEDQRCSECHDVIPSSGTPSLINAFHRRCQGCHLEKKSGPVMCGECHRWESGDREGGNHKDDN